MQQKPVSQQPMLSSLKKGATIKRSASNTNQDPAAHYLAWLSADAQHNSTASSQERMASYLDDALRAVIVKGRHIKTFAPFRAQHSALQTITSGQITTIIVLLLAGVSGLIALGTKMIVTVMAVVTVFYLSDLLLSFWLVARTLSQPSEEQIDDEMVQALADANWPHYTILCPLYKEVAVLPQFLRSIQALDYPTEKLQVLLLTEENDAQMRQAIQEMNLPAHFTTLTVPAGTPQTKPRACNFGLVHTTGAYVVIYDAEDVPDPLQLKKAILTFAHHGPDLACVQAKLNFYNPRQNLLTRWFTAEYSSWFDLMLPALQRGRLPLPLGGTSNHFRTEILRALGAWDAFNVTEDCDLGLRLTRYRLKTAVLDSTTYEEANPHPKNWLRQRSRWIKGYMLTYLIHMRQPWRYLRQRRLREFLWLQVLLGSKTAVLLVNPFMWLLLAIYITLRPFVGNTYHAWFPMPVLYMGTICLVFGNFFYVYTHLIGCLKRGLYDLIKWALLIPFYWAMMSVAAYIAFYQLLVKPHYWEKTQHGFHLQRPDSPAGKAASTRVDKLSPPLPSPEPPGSSQMLTLLTTRPSPQRRGATSPWLIITLLTGGLGGIASCCVLKQKPVKWGRPGLVRWALFMTLSWVLMSIVPLLALRPRLFKARDQGSIEAVGAAGRSQWSSDVTSITDALKALKTTTAPSLKQSQIGPLPDSSGFTWRSWLKDRWLIVTIAIACLASVSSWWYFFQHHQVLLYGDAYAHLLIARRLFDNAAPGLAQLGGVWLPLPHLLMIPFIWNDTLWSTGLAGSIPSMGAYVIAAGYLYLAARRLTHDSRASFLGTLVFVLNPNILYLQATPLSELVLIAALTAGAYYFLVWAQEDQPKQLIWAAATMFLATVSRYDGWPLFLAALALIALIGRLKGHSWGRIQGNLLVFGTLGGLGIGLWLCWCAIIFGDPLYFQRGPFSAQAQQKSLIAAKLLYTDHNLWQSLRYYAIASSETLGPLLFVLGIAALIVFLVRHRTLVSALASLLFLTPLAFYVISLYQGQAALFVPGAVPINAPYHLFNARYGAVVVAPAALFLATLVGRQLLKKRIIRSLGQGLLLLLLLVQTGLTATGGIITLQDGEFGLACTPTHQVILYLAQHYAGGMIMEDLYASKLDALGPKANIDFKNIVYEGSGGLWDESLHHPEAVVNWLIANPSNPDDLVAKHLDLSGSTFLAYFTPVVHEADGLTLFQLRSIGHLPTRSLPADLLAVHHCGTSGSTAEGQSLATMVSDHGYQDTATSSGWETGEVLTLIHRRPYAAGVAV